MHVTLPSGTPAESALPADGRAPTQGLVVIPDIGGLRPLFSTMIQRLADEQGWAVCTFEPWPGRQDLNLQQRLDQVGTLTDASLLGDASAAADACGVEPVGVVGFCMGGMFALKAAGTGRFARSVAFYGMIRVPETWRSSGHSEPLDALASPEACPTLAIIGTADIWTPPEDVADLEAAGVTVVRYEGAGHGFAHDADRPAHRAEDAADAWRRAVAFLRDA
ncbi:MAG TPA: dienelactone hydrolase family protein [Acidimicrobiales bacterium]|jgi:carboxymethylenebutenolidase